MTFVLLVAGIDLSVGANMSRSCIVVALVLKGWTAIFGFLVVGLSLRRLVFGAVNGFVITRLACRAVHRHARHPVHRPGDRALSLAA